jgi:hypothetical protein
LVACRAVWVTTQRQDFDRLECQHFILRWIGVHSLDDANAMPAELTRTCRWLQMRIGSGNVASRRPVDAMEAGRLFSEEAHDGVDCGACLILGQSGLVH